MYFVLRAIELRLQFRTQHGSSPGIQRTLIGQKGNSEMSDNEKATPPQAREKHFQAQIDSTESQLMTPSQLQLPTLSALVQDVPNIDQFRPKEIVHQDGKRIGGTGSNSVTGKESLASAIDPQSNHNDWDIPKALIETSTDLQLYEVKPRSQNEVAWTLAAKWAADHRSVTLHVGKNAPQRSKREELLAHLGKLQVQTNRNLVQQLRSSWLLGDHPYVVEEHVDGLTLRECHPGIHLPGTQLNWKTPHALQLLTVIRDVAFAVDELHQSEILSAEISVDTIKLTRLGGLAKLTQVGPLAPLQTSASSRVGESKPLADIQSLGKIAYAMLFCSSLNPAHKLENPPLANWSPSDFAARLSTYFPSELAEIVFKSRHAIRSQNFSSAREFGLAIDSVLKNARGA
jgi:hypothetical protein